MAEHEGAGYAVLSVRLEAAEREIKELKKEMKDLSKDSSKGFNEVNDRIDELNIFTSEVKIMLSNFSVNQNEMKEDIKGIAASAGKDSGWRALITDIIKAVLLILGFFATGKFLM